MVNNPWAWAAFVIGGLPVAWWFLKLIGLVDWCPLRSMRDYMRRVHISIQRGTNA